VVRVVEQAMCREVRPRATLGRSAELLGLVECSENLLRLTFGHDLESFTDRFRERLGSTG